MNEMKEWILTLDLGTTNWKAALFGRGGELLQLGSMPAPEIDRGGCPVYDPFQLPGHLERLLSLLDDEKKSRVCAVGLTGMAESGGLVSRKDHRPLTEIRPWFDRRSLPVFDAWRGRPAFQGRQAVTGLPDSFKYGIFKLLSFRESGAELRDACLLGVVEQAFLALTDSIGEDATLAARTGAYDVRRRCWDEGFLRALNLPLELLPPVRPLGKTPEKRFGLPGGIPVLIGGHDHVCAAFGAGALTEGRVMLSMGTAQVMLTGRKELSAEDLNTGLSFGPAPKGKGFTCLGSIQAAGGSLNYWKKLLFPGQDYAAMIARAEQAALPTGLTWYPYLGGSGAPHLNPGARAGLTGLSADTGPAEIISAVYEGIAMESRFVLSAMGSPKQLTCLGGLTRHPRLMRILAAVNSAEVFVPRLEEGTLYGAARLAAEEALGQEDFPILRADASIMPEPALQSTYDQKYLNAYLPGMRALLQEEGA